LKSTTWWLQESFDSKERKHEHVKHILQSPFGSVEYPEAANRSVMYTILGYRKYEEAVDTTSL
jgi:hypothetical protein